MASTKRDGRENRCVRCKGRRYLSHDAYLLGFGSSDRQNLGQHGRAQGEFLELVPSKRIVQRIVFESENPAFAGAMTMTWNLDEVSGGTKVTIVCENVPAGIRQEDHEAGMSSTLANLAAFLE